MLVAHNVWLLLICINKYVIQAALQDSIPLLHNQMAEFVKVVLQLVKRVLMQIIVHHATIIITYFKIHAFNHALLNILPALEFVSNA